MVPAHGFFDEGKKSTVWVAVNPTQTGIGSNLKWEARVPNGVTFERKVRARLRGQGGGREGQGQLHRRVPAGRENQRIEEDGG